MSFNIQALTTEVRSGLEALESSLPSEIDGPALCPESKLPFKVLSAREALCWRFAETCRSAFDALDKDLIVSSLLLTRASMESVAALWFLDKRVRKAIEARRLDELDDYLMRLRFGSRIEADELRDAINVLTFVDSVDKTVQGFRQQYDLMSEYCHPNHRGTMFQYSKLDRERGIATFGRSIRNIDGPKGLGLTNLAVGLDMFRHVYNEMGTNQMSEFLQLCGCSTRIQTSALETS